MIKILIGLIFFLGLGLFLTRNLGLFPALILFVIIAIYKAGKYILK